MPTKLRHVTYWACRCLDDGHAYNLRARTKNEVRRMRIKEGAERYGPPAKVVIAYASTLDLVFSMQGEGFDAEADLPDGLPAADDKTTPEEECDSTE